VREVDALTWDIEHVKGLDHAVFTTRVSPFEDRALVTVLVMADVDGKCGAAQAVHAMNVMCGFEECLGLRVPNPV
jgi:N-acetyl-gamma-glutamylphosphate reductase